MNRIEAKTIIWILEIFGLDALTIDVARFSIFVANGGKAIMPVINMNFNHK